MPDAAKDFLSPFASLKLTVVLMAMATFLVFAGTVAQIDHGIWTVVEEYFRCAFAWIEFQVFFPRSWEVPGGIWFPGGWLIGGLLFVNILAAHLIRFKVRAGGGKLGTGIAVLVGGAILTWMIIVGVFDQEIAATESAAFWRVLLRLAKGGGAAIVLMIGCILVFERRAGIVLLHGGVILLLVSEFITGSFAIEGRMRIPAGESVNYVEHMRSVEFVFIDRSDAEQDRVTVVPARRLRKGGRIEHPELPVAIEIVRSMANSRLADATRVGPNVVNPATAGSGLQAIAIEEPEVSGTDTEQTIDIPAAYVQLFDLETDMPLGTYLVTPWFNRTVLQRQVVVAGGRPYELEMRFARTYKPYSIELVEFRHDKYVGTETPKNFSSLVHLVDEDKGVDRTVKIWMNNPLRYAGETFYQSSFEPGRNVTILQVVRNDGWMLPYLSCMIVGAGMSLHMGRNLYTFLRRRLVS
jgi:hypothetical protein